MDVDEPTSSPTKTDKLKKFKYSKKTSKEIGGYTVLPDVTKSVTEKVTLYSL